MKLAEALSERENHFFLKLSFLFHVYVSLSIVCETTNNTPLIQSRFAPMKDRSVPHIISASTNCSIRNCTNSCDTRGSNYNTNDGGKYFFLTWSIPYAILPDLFFFRYVISTQYSIGYRVNRLCCVVVINNTRWCVKVE